MEKLQVHLLFYLFLFYFILFYFVLFYFLVKGFYSRKEEKRTKKRDVKGI